MEDEQNKNYILIQRDITQLQAEIEKTEKFSELRKTLIGLRSNMKEVNLRPEHQKKFIGWITKLLYRINDREKEVILASVAGLENTLAGLKDNIAQKVDINALRGKAEGLFKWVTVNEAYVTKNPGKPNVIDLPGLRLLKENIASARSAIIEVQRKRTAHFRQVKDDFESKIAVLEQEVRELTADNMGENYNRLFKGLRNLLAAKDKFHPKKRELYRARIVDSLDLLVELRKEKRSAEKIVASQQNKARFETILNEIEASLGEERLTNARLKELRQEVIEKVRKPITEKNENGRYAVFIIKQHHNELINYIRTLLSQIDERFNENSSFVQECISNKAEMENVLKELRDRFEEYREGHYEGTGMGKGNLLRALNEIQSTIKLHHQGFNNKHYFVKDKLAFREVLNDMWTDTKNLLQVVASPTWSIEWLQQKIEMNSKQGNSILQIVADVPRP